jgi:hypothetical protein
MTGIDVAVADLKFVCLLYRNFLLTVSVNEFT